MKLATLLHFYQPHNQQLDILDRIVYESYVPVTEGLLKIPSARATFNITASLLNLLSTHKYDRVIQNISRLLENGQVELTSSAVYHALLPLLSKDEVIRQVQQHDTVCRSYFGDLYKPKGFFPPEMAVNEELVKIIEEMGYKWVAVPELASAEYEGPLYNYTSYNSNIKLMFRNKRVSSLILLSLVKSSSEFIKETRDLHNDPYWFSVMDVETFGHHRIGHEELLFDLMKSNKFRTLQVSDIMDLDLQTKKVPIRACTWTNQEQDFFLKNSDEVNSFILWKDPSNPIHTLQWEFTQFVIDQVTNYKKKDEKEWKNARNKLDYAVASDQYWWASAKPWWSLEMIELGAFSLKDIVLNLKLSKKIKEEADNYYRNIMDKAFEWHRTGYIREIHLSHSEGYKKEPLKKRTHNEWYNQIVLEFEDEMNKAVRNNNFELAIKWRDAIIKLKQGTDMFDVLHVVDELWTVRSIPSLKPFFEYSYDEFSEFAKQNFLGFKTKAEFEKWQMTKEKKYTQE